MVVRWPEATPCMTLLETTAALGIEGYLHLNEAEKLTELAIGKDVLEVGSFRGLSAYCMARVAKTLMCVDTFKADGGGQTQQDTFTTLEGFDRAVGRFKNVHRFIASSEQAHNNPLFAYSSYDFVFIDAMHTFDSVKLDIECWWPRVRTGGVMAFHDYGHRVENGVMLGFPGVKEAADALLGEPYEVVHSLGLFRKP